MRLRIAALTLALSLGLVGLASAEESASWWSKLWPGSKAEPAKKAEVSPDAVKAAEVAAVQRLKQASDDLERRQQVCNKLIDIANATNDDELRRKAELLDRRAYDLYVAAKTRAYDRRYAEPEVKKEGRK